MVLFEIGLLGEVVVTDGTEVILPELSTSSVDWKQQAAVDLIEAITHPLAGIVRPNHTTEPTRI